MAIASEIAVTQPTTTPRERATLAIQRKLPHAMGTAAGGIMIDHLAAELERATP